MALIYSSVLHGYGALDEGKQLSTKYVCIVAVSRSSTEQQMEVNGILLI
jgi:hypothetical protein